MGSEDISTWEDGHVTNGEQMGNKWGTIGASVRLILASASDSPTQNGRVTSGGGQLGVRILASASDSPTQNRWLLLACPRILALKLLERSTSCPNKETENRSLKSRQDNSCDK